MSDANKFAICVFSGDNALLTSRRIYQVLPDESAERSEYVRIIDDEGEDYLYPKDYFVFVSVPADAATAILQTV